MYISRAKFIGWFQKISIPIPRAASRNSEGEGGGYVDWNSEDMGGFIGLEFRRHGGVHWTGIPKAWGIFRRVNFQFGAVKSLQGNLVKNDLSKDDDSLVNTRRSTQSTCRRHISMVVVNIIFMLTGRLKAVHLSVDRSQKRSQAFLRLFCSNTIL